jgi:enoyl-[acyl-carrier protein] reductase/trans-2-enoyl-CoA reductase (NAD+)
MDRAATAINAKLSAIHGSANVAVLKSVVTQASAAIPVMPLYIAMSFKVMKQQNIHEGCLEQIDRMFRSQLYQQGGPELDESRRIRMDDWELRNEVQDTIKQVWPKVTSENIFELTDYQGYKDEFMKLFGFGIETIDYEAEVDPLVDFHPINI